MMKSFVLIFLLSINAFAIDPEDRDFSDKKDFRFDVNSKKETHRLSAEKEFYQDSKGKRNMYRMYKKESKAKNKAFCAVTHSKASCDIPKQGSSNLYFDSSCMMERKEKVVLRSKKLKSCRDFMDLILLTLKHDSSSTFQVQYFPTPLEGSSMAASKAPLEE